MIIEIPQNDIDKINIFVEKSINTHTNYYKKRNQNDIDKIKQDIYNGKLAEFGVYYFYKDRINITYPDINIYQSSNKSFDSDFIINEKINLHVKSQHKNLSKRFGMSWSFQKEDSLTKNPEENDWVIFTLIADYNKVEIIKKMKGKELVDKYKEPQLDKLKGIKKVIYYDDIKNI